VLNRRVRPVRFPGVPRLETWLPDCKEAHVGMLALLRKGFRLNAVARYSDYKRFNMETLATIAKPRQRPPAEPRPRRLRRARGLRSVQHVANLLLEHCGSERLL
jgi:hypothetical protein